jgi:hypothetical protein
MGARAFGSNSQPRREEKKALKRRKELAAKYMANGMTEEAANQRAQLDMRDNSRRNWRKG